MKSSLRILLVVLAVLLVTTSDTQASGKKKPVPRDSDGHLIRKFYKAKPSKVNLTKNFAKPTRKESKHPWFIQAGKLN